MTSPKTQLSQKILLINPKYLPGKRKKKNIRERLGRRTLNMCAKFEIPETSLKNGVDIGLTKNLGGDS